MPTAYVHTWLDIFHLQVEYGHPGSSNNCFFGDPMKVGCRITGYECFRTPYIAVLALLLIA